MEKGIKLTFNLKGLEDLKNSLGGKYVARVGILGAKASSMHNGTQLTNSQIGAIQMFGSVVSGIPPRDFLVMPLQITRRDLMKNITNSGAIKQAIQAKDYKKVFKQIGILAEQVVQRAFETSGFGQWPPNKPSTIARKGSDRPLIDTGQLRRSITSDVASGDNRGAGGAV